MFLPVRYILLATQISKQNHTQYADMIEANFHSILFTQLPNFIFMNVKTHVM